MSIANKKPFIQTLLEDLTTAELANLKLLLDGQGNQTILQRTMSNVSAGGRTKITVADKGVHRCNLEMNGGLYLLNGYLIYSEHYCVLIYYVNDFQKLGWLSVDVANEKFNYINEELSILEIRSELDDTAKAEKAEIIATVSEAVTAGTLDLASKEYVDTAITGAINNTY